MPSDRLLCEAPEEKMVTSYIFRFYIPPIVLKITTFIRTKKLPITFFPFDINSISFFSNNYNFNQVD